jgi:hypothetical protein
MPEQKPISDFCVNSSVKTDMWSYKILDKVFILFLVLNTLYLDFFFLNLNIRYGVLCVAVLLSLPYLRLRKPIVYFLFFAFLFAAFLTLYSIFRGNEFSNIMVFVTPYFFLLGIFPLSVLIERYSLRRYLNVVFVSIGFLILAFFILNVLFFLDPVWLYGISETKSKVFMLTFNENNAIPLPRIFLSNFVLILPFSFRLFLGTKKLSLKIIALIFLLILIVISQTYGFLFGLAVGLVIYFCNQYGPARTLFFTFFISLVITPFFISQSQKVEIEELKANSISVKKEQFVNFDKDMGVYDIFFGRGIGVTFKNFDARRNVDTMLEVSIIQAFQMGGIFGGVLIMFVYVFHIIAYGYRMSIKRLSKTGLLLFVSQASIFTASLANPYMWSGGTGLLFIIFMAVHRENVGHPKLLVKE